MGRQKNKHNNYLFNLILYKTFILRSLVTMLGEEGIDITTATAIDIEKILAKTEVEKLQRLSELKYTLSPLICRNKEEQITVYKIFDKLDVKVAQEYTPGIEEEDTITVVEKQIKRQWKKIISPYYLKRVLLPFGIITAVLFVLYLVRGKIFPDSLPRPGKIYISVHSPEIVVNDTAHFEAVTDSAIDKKNISVDWKFDDERIQNTFFVSKVFSDTQMVYVTAYLKSADGNILDSDYYAFRVQCEDAPSVAIEVTDATVNNTSGNKKKFAPVFANPSVDSNRYSYQWYVNDLPYGREKILNYAKAYNTIRLVVGCKNIHCSRDSLVAEVSSIPAVDTRVAVDGLLKIESVYNWRNILFSALLLLFVPGIISFLLYRIILSVRNYLPRIKKTEPGTEGPYKIEFNQQYSSINTEEGIRKLADMLRKRQVSDTYKLNLRKTIRSTIISGGMPNLEFTPMTKPVSYLVFIDKENPESHLVKLFEYLVQKLEKDEVNIYVYAYFKEPLYLSNEKLNHDRIPLEKVAALYPDTTLFIFGDAKYFLFPLKGTVKNWVTRKLSNWPTKILVTPYAKDDWDKKEKLLIESKFVVLPADLSSLPVIDKIISRQIDIQAQTKEHIENAYRSRFLNFQEFETLREYLGEGPLLQWVCSIAVYPAVDFNFTIALGKAIEKQLQGRDVHADLVNYTNLLKIGRISWMQDGIINESLRAQMLSYLDKDAEALARKTLSSQLYLLEDTIADDSLVKSRFDIHKKLNQFLLDAHERKKISAEDEAFIKKMSAAHQLDEGQDIYLGEGRNTMLAHPFRKNREVGLDRYFTLKWYREILLSSGFAVPAFIALFLIGLSLLKNNTDYLEWKTIKPVAQTYIITGSGNTPLDISVQVYYDDEGLNDTTVNINLAGDSTGFTVDSVTIKDTNSYGRYVISTGNGNWIWGDSFKLNAAVYYFYINETAKINLKILYDNSASLSLANTVAENLPSAFNVNMQQQSFSDTSMVRVYYFSERHRQDAELAAVTASNLFSRSIQPQLVDSVNFARAQEDVVVYVKQSDICTPLDVAALPQSLNEIWVGGTSKRFININKAQQLVYYSDDNARTFTKYSINDVCLLRSGAYRIIVSDNNLRYKLMFFRNVKPGSFELSVCEGTARTREELQGRDESYCDKFNSMAWYYENNPGYIYLPTNAPVLRNTEKQKLDRKADSLQKDESIDKYSISLFSGSYTDAISQNTVKQYLEGSNFQYAVSRNSSLLYFTSTDIPGNQTPFSRSYLTVNFEKKEIIEPVIDPPLRCDMTFTSIDETRKLESPLVVCKLDLSKANLTSLPKELYAFTKMQELNLGVTAIPQSDINQLQDALPKCKIIYRVPQTQLKDIDLGYITFDEKNNITQSGRDLLDRIAKVMVANPGAGIILEAGYSDKKVQKQLTSNMKDVMNYFNKLGVSDRAGRITEKITGLEDQKQNQQAQQSLRPDYRIHVTGLNFPENFISAPQSKY